MGEFFKPEVSRGFQREIVPPRGGDYRRRIKSRVNIHKLPTKRNYKIPDKREAISKGHKIEQMLANAIEKFPGVEYVRLSSNIEEAEKVDIVVKFKGESTLLKIQVTSNATAIEGKLQEIPKGVVLLYVSENDFTSEGELTKRALYRISELIIKHMPLNLKESLIDYHQAD